MKIPNFSDVKHFKLIVKENIHNDILTFNEI